MIWLFAAALAGPPTPLQQHMQGHFADATDAMWLVASADLEHAREEAANLDHAPSDSLPLELKPLAENLRMATRALAAATDLDTAAREVGRLTATCAACHAAAANGPSLAPDHVGRPGETEASHMWAVYWLWVGLVVPEERAWSDGVELLDAKKVSEHPKYSLVEDVAKAFAEQSAAARKATTHAEREAAFSGLLGTCSRCHQSLGLEL